MERLFVYGTLQDPDVQMLLIGRIISGEPARLRGYRINPLLMPPYPVAMPDAQGTIGGKVLEVSSEELQKLDAYEGECYLRICVGLENAQEAWVYIGNPACYPDV